MIVTKGDRVKFEYKGRHGTAKAFGFVTKVEEGGGDAHGSDVSHVWVKADREIHLEDGWRGTELRVPVADFTVLS